ncbi:hypothetical protein EMIT0P218_30250 [Pseudomonas sp. IT-P218]
MSLLLSALQKYAGEGDSVTSGCESGQGFLVDVPSGRSALRRESNPSKIFSSVVFSTPASLFLF